MAVSRALSDDENEYDDEAGNFWTHFVRVIFVARCFERTSYNCLKKHRNPCQLISFQDFDNDEFENETVEDDSEEDMPKQRDANAVVPWMRFTDLIQFFETQSFDVFVKNMFVLNLVGWFLLLGLWCLHFFVGYHGSLSRKNQAVASFIDAAGTSMPIPVVS